MRQGRQSGTSLVEAVVVVAIVLTLSALAAENFLRSRQAALEAAAASNMQAIANAETAFAVTHPEIGYVPLSRLGPEGENLLDRELAGGTKQGYLFQVELEDGQRAFTIHGIPTNSGGKTLVFDSFGNLRPRECAKSTCEGAGRWTPSTARGSN